MDVTKRQFILGIMFLSAFSGSKTWGANLFHPIAKEATSSLAKAKPEVPLQRSEKMGRRQKTQTPHRTISPETKKALLAKLEITELVSTLNQFKI